MPTLATHCQRTKLLSLIKAELLDTLPIQTTEELEAIKAALGALENFSVLNAANDSFYLSLRRAVASLGYSHTRLASSDIEFFGPAHCKLQLDGDQLFLYLDGELKGQVAKIDGQPWREIHKYWMSLTGGATDHYRSQKSLDNLLLSTKDAPAKIELAGKETIELPRINPPPWNESPMISSRIENNVGHIKISHFRDQGLIKIFDEMLEQIMADGAEKIIIDLRDNSGGNSKIAFAIGGRFFAEKTFSVSTKSRVAGTDDFTTSELWIEPRGKHVDLSLTVLVNNLTFSTSELLVAAIKDSGRATIKGTITGGGTSNPIKKTITTGDLSAEMMISTWLAYRKNGEEIEGVGIEVDK